MPHRRLYLDAPLRTLLFGRRRGLRLTGDRPRGHKLLAAVGAVWLLLGIGAGGALWRLSQGPIGLDMLKPRIEAKLNEALGGRFSLALGGVALERGGTTGLALRADEVFLQDRDGHPLGRIDSAEVGLDPAALLFGRIEIRRLTLAAPSIRIRRTAEGLNIAAGPRHGDAAAPTSAPTPDALGAVAGALDAALRFASTDALGLQSLQIEDAELDYADESGGRVLLPNVDAELKRGKAGPVTLDFAVGPAEARVNGLIQAWDGDGRREIQGRIDGLRLGAVVAAHDPAVAAFARQPLSLTFTVPVSESGSIAGATATLEAASFDKPGSDLPLRGALRLRLDPAAHEAVIEPSRIGIARGSGTLAGTLAWGSGDGVGIRLEATKVRLDHVQGAAPVDLRRVTLAGQGSIADKSLRIDRFVLDADRAKIDLSGVLVLGERSPAVRIEGEASATDASALKQVWPFFVAPEARQWVLGHVDSGRLASLRFKTDIAKDWLARAEDREMVLPQDAIAIALDFDAVRFSTVGSLPAVGLNGSGTIDGNRMTLTGSGAAQLPSGRVLRLRQGRFEVPNVHPKIVDGVMRLEIESDAAALVELMGRPPLARLAEQLPFGPADVAGRADARIHLALPLRSDVAPEAVIWDGDVDLGDLAVSALPQGRKLEKAQMALHFAGGTVAVSGKGILDGAPANIDLKIDDLLKRVGAPTRLAGGLTRNMAGSHDPVPDKPDPASSYGVSVLVDEKTGERFGLAFGGLVQGPMVVKAHGGLEGDGATRVDIDLTNARIGTPALGTLKPEGRKAEASFTLVRDGDGKELRDFRLTGDGFQARGTVNLGADGAFASAEMSEFRLAPSDQAALTLRSHSGGLVASVTGKRLDAGRLLRTLTATGESAGRGGAVDLSVKVDRLIGLNGEELRGASLRYAGRDGRISDLTLSGRFASGGALGARTRVDPTKRELVLVSHDAGALLRFLDIYSRLQQGGLELRMDLGGGPNTAGALSVVDFRVVDEEGLRKLTASAGRPLRKDEETEIGATQPFQSLKLSFVKDGDKIRIDNGVASGPFSGATFQGVVDRKAERVDISGTYVPIYLLNNMFAKLPLVGPILGGRSGEGLVGVTFALRGPMSSPALLVNPVSVAAPGVLRHLFEFAAGGHPQEPVAPVPTPPDEAR